MKTITIAGNVAKDAELKRTQDGDPMAVFSVAVDDGFGDKKTTMWFDVTIFGKRGQSLQPHITKGTKLTVIGDLSRREHNDKTYLTVRASEVALQGGNARQETRVGTQDPKRPNQTKPVAQSPAYSDDMDDTIPFAPEWR